MLAKGSEPLETHSSPIGREAAPWVGHCEPALHSLNLTLLTQLQVLIFSNSLPDSLFILSALQLYSSYLAAASNTNSLS